MTAPRKSHGKTLEEWDKHCLKKHRYSDEITARLSAQHVINAHHQSPDIMSVYRCQNCRGWHMTKKKNELPWVTADDLFYVEGPKPLQIKTATHGIGTYRRFVEQ